MAKITVTDIYNQIWDLMKELGGELSYYPNEVNDNNNGEHSFHITFPQSDNFKITITKEK
ncbi:MAG: hypothetical protein IJP63_06710 [Acholeplasmatales bacterium]|nr:hypothetical protein [Acholeplasmatales bacterium]